MLHPRAAGAWREAAFQRTLRPWIALDPFSAERGVGPSPDARRVVRLVLGVVEHLAGVCARDRLPALPGDVDDHECDHEADDWVGELESERDDGGAGQHAEAD